MTERMGRTWLVVFAGAVAASISLNAQDDGKDKKDQKEQKKASLSLKATPPIAFSPARMVVSAELKELGRDRRLLLPQPRMGLG
jgi:hypothetical protein